LASIFHFNGIFGLNHGFLCLNRWVGSQTLEHFDNLRLDKAEDRLSADLRNFFVILVLDCLVKVLGNRILFLAERCRGILRKLHQSPIDRVDIIEEDLHDHDLEVAPSNLVVDCLLVLQVLDQTALELDRFFKLVVRQ